MDTTIATNQRNECDSSREAIDASIYIKTLGSLMYMVNTRPDISYEANQLS